MSRERISGPCNTVETGCLAPPAFVDNTRARCFRCGEPVCTNCSVVRSYINYGRRRLCGRCVEELDREKKEKR